MKYSSFAELIEALKTHQEFSNEIKFKRLKKQLEMLSHYENPETEINSIQLTSLGIELLIVNAYRQRTYDYNLILDVQYPFSRPQIHYTKKQSYFSYCKDLIDILLEGNNWGPSIMISYFLDKIQQISESIQQNIQIQGKLLYHQNQQYRKQYLQSMNIKLFQIDEYTWKYLIKTSKKRILGLTDQVFLLFSESKHQQNIILEFCKPISQIITAKASVTANKKFSLQIAYKQNQKQIKRYFAGTENVQIILGLMNPIQMIQRKISSIGTNPTTQTLNQYWSQNTDMIKQFTQLIEFYSLKDNVKSQKYIKLMKNFIGKFYQIQIKNKVDPSQAQQKEQKLQVNNNGQQPQQKEQTQQKEQENRQQLSNEEKSDKKYQFKIQQEQIQT